MIDGQHRAKAIQNICDSVKDKSNDSIKRLLETRVLLQITRFKNRKEALEYYNIINIERQPVRANKDTLTKIFDDEAFLSCESDSDSDHE